MQPLKERYSSGFTLKDISDADEQSKKGRKLGGVELKPGGSKIQVTTENRAELLQLYMPYRLLGALKNRLKRFDEDLACFNQRNCSRGCDESARQQTSSCC